MRRLFAAWARRAPIDGKFVTGNESAPVGRGQEVIEGRATRLNAGARQRVTRIWIQKEQDIRRLYMVAVMLAQKIRALNFGHAVYMHQPVDTERATHLFFPVLRNDLAFGSAGGNNNRIGAESI